MVKPKAQRAGADHYAASNESIYELISGEANGAGGLMSLRREEDGTLTVDLYRLDENVRVMVPARNLHRRQS